MTGAGFGVEALESVVWVVGLLVFFGGWQTASRGPGLRHVGDVSQLKCLRYLLDCAAGELEKGAWGTLLGVLYCSYVFGS